MKRITGIILLLTWVIGCAAPGPRVPDRVMMTNPQTGEWRYIWRGRCDSATWAGMGADQQYKAEFMYTIEALKSKGFTNIREVR